MSIAVLSWAAPLMSQDISQFFCRKGTWRSPVLLCWVCWKILTLQQVGKHL